MFYKIFFTFEASKVVSIAQHLKPKYIRMNSNVYSCLTFAFTSLINATRDIEPLVSQKSISYIETLSESALKSIMICFELQFDSVIFDRILILQALVSLNSTLYNIKTNTILTWEFFMHRFSTLSIEAQLSYDNPENDCLMPIDTSGTNASAQFHGQIKIAKFALLQTKYIRSISKPVEIQNISKKTSVEINDSNNAESNCESFENTKRKRKKN
jgi:hypothetical protein